MSAFLFGLAALAGGYLLHAWLMIRRAHLRLEEARPGELRCRECGSEWVDTI